jgi:hypothetical protein
MRFLIYIFIAVIGIAVFTTVYNPNPINIGNLLRSLADKFDGTPKPTSILLNGNITLAKSEVLAKLRDPNSAQFRNIIEKNSGAVCGEFNSKNGFGGYDSFAPFLYLTKDISLKKDNVIGHYFFLSGIKYETSSAIDYILMFKNQLYLPRETEVRYAYEDELYLRICKELP